MFPFQTIFQHIFNCLMGDLAEQIATTQCFGIEFENVGLNRLMSVRFWKEIVHLNKKSDKTAIDKTAAEATSSFVKEGLQFIQYLISQVLSQAGLSSEMVKGLAAFNPFVLFKRPSEVGLRHFEVLYSTFQLRSWVTSANENSCRDEYLALLDHLRVNYPLPSIST